MDYNKLVDAILSGDKDTADQLFGQAMEEKSFEVMDEIQAQTKVELDESLMELSPKTLGSYIQKASRSARAKSSLAADFKRSGDSSAVKAYKASLAGDKETADKMNSDSEANYKLGKDFERESDGRVKGIARAATKLTKKAMGEESVEEDTVTEKTFLNKIKQKLADADKKKEKEDAAKSLKQTVDGYMSVGQKPKKAGDE